MKLIFQIATLIVAAYFVNKQWIAAKPLEPIYFQTIPIKVAMPADTKINKHVNQELSFEQAVKNDDDFVMATMVFDSVADSFTQDSITELEDEDISSIVDKQFMAQGGLPQGVSLDVLGRGFIEHQGRQGYSISLRMNHGEDKETILQQQIYVYKGHMVMLMTTSSGSMQDENTSEAYFNSLEFMK
ncbi:hypothetical protein [Motilimonas pumila]|uniref:DUF1795 domain-containing protein n=1 Tax=Motilimonas pumila TaxID=2303987 RepID=A0A418YBT6_9GAMM|nr:hypothetical protein [Motilimonas pumila]RJG41922.1 hypothetical protein D1Z90_15630 [Motilimonas pumila]